ncbi:MAG: TIGR00268 family protein [Desulfobacca sp.]|nr:TIGR00268 family protein [Desulfobacca sp.]
MSPSKIQNMITFLRERQDGAVAFSGGVDSTLLLYLAREAWTDPPLALTFLSPLLRIEEKERIQRLAELIGVRQHWLKTKEYLDLKFKRNTPARCYYCKKSRFRQAQPFLNQRGVRFILDGTNADDLKAYRPGIRASREANVISPLALLGWTKPEIRKASRELGLPTWDQPSSPCLATRVAYGHPITLPLLKRLALGETALASMGLKECRLRLHSSLVRIEVPENEFSLFMDRTKRQTLLTRLSDLGFTYITLDLKGFRSGSMDEVLKTNKRNI